MSMKSTDPHYLNGYNDGWEDATKENQKIVDEIKAESKKYFEIAKTNELLVNHLMDEAEMRRT